MKNIKKMYSNILADNFPDNISFSFGDTVLNYKRKNWLIDGDNKGLRYGENPDQPAALYELSSGSLEYAGLAYRGAEQALVSAISESNMLQSGKHPSKTNFTDIDSGIKILESLHSKPAAAIIKHNNPSGVAWSDLGILDAFSKAFWCDRIAAFGGTIVVNSKIDKATADLINSSYFEVVAAPDYDKEALNTLMERKNLRIFKLPGLANLNAYSGMPFVDITSLSDGGLVVQQSFVNRIKSVKDFLPAIAEKEGLAVSARLPSKQEAEDLLFAWAVCSSVTSNAVVFAKDGATVSIGTGEQDRVGCVELAIHKSYTKYADKLAFKKLGLSYYELKQKSKTDSELATVLSEIDAETKQVNGDLKGSVMVSDGFFPFRDGVDVAIEQGVLAIAQPGGAIRDYEVIQAVNQASPQVSMVFTGQRSFVH